MSERIRRGKGKGAKLSSTKSLSESAVVNGIEERGGTWSAAARSLRCEIQTIRVTVFPQRYAILAHISLSQPLKY